MNHHKKILSMLLLVMLLCSILPSAAWAADTAYTWPSFRGQENNMAITNTLLPTSTTNAALKWAVPVRTGVGAATQPILVGDYLYSASKDTLYMLNKEDGRIEKSVKLQGSIGFYPMPVIYGDGKVFVSCDGGQVEAFSAETLEPLWISEKLLGGSLASPATYKDGQLYTGTYDWAGTQFEYGALAVTEQAVGADITTRQYVWRMTDTSHFYWNGAYAADQAVIFGSGSGKVYSVAPKDGKQIDVIDAGDSIHSSIAYDADTEAIYLTTASGYLVKIELDKNGTFGAVAKAKLPNTATCTPVVYDGLVFVTAGSFNGENKILVYDARDLSPIASAETNGYVQSSVLLSTAYEANGKLYCYYTYNSKPGGIDAAIYDCRDNTLTTKTIFTPKSEMQNASLCSLICDAEGTFYYSNDSGYVMAVGWNSDAAQALMNQLTAADGLHAADYTAESWAKLQEVKSAAWQALEAGANNEELWALEEALAAAIAALQPTQGGSGGGSEETKMTVSFQLIGDTVHEQPEQHTAYEDWIGETIIEIEENQTVFDIFQQVVEDYGFDYEADGSYISAIRSPDGYWLGEFDNGPNSGWKYLVNGEYPDTGAGSYPVKDGDAIVWQYVDDYTSVNDDISQNGDVAVLTPIDEEKQLTTGAGVTDLIKQIGKIDKNSGAALQAARQAYDKLSVEEQKLVTNYALLVAAEREYQRLINPLPFVDVPQGHWAEEAIHNIYSKDLMGGTSEDRFMPNAALDRAMLVTILYRLEGEPAVSAANSFSDVADNRWYTQAILWASDNQLISGYGKSIFGPNDALTREQLAVLLYRYAQHRGYDTDTTKQLEHFTDAGQISDWAKTALAWANEKGLLTGRSKTSIAPQEPVTRAETAVILTRYLQMTDADN